MIARILACDGCGQTAGATASISGSQARRSDHAGTIRRVRLGRVVSTFATRGDGREPVTKVSPVNADLCARCRYNGTLETLRDLKRTRTVYGVWQDA